MKNEFYTVTSSTYPADIQILKGKLESEGIPVFLRDENTINTDPLISDAIGGVKLQVYELDKEKAIAIIKDIEELTALPATDVVLMGPDKLVTAVLQN